ncbi:acyltransferase family protein [Mycobacterium paraseoulense]|uniref:Acyltransferase n=1 Tax=Mycobacterium paraseoulense TaxID=590652 RepID=A0A1X0I3E5_9MYCO|nr:acyltransferase [Mycobacterium paraseoulense]MCV7394697.1 acyltransferase [Mycobacterium paraseoulense]ORB33716.1 acyltransferase [Mycobacterium paraseoulense]BBZ73627.1 acyltransferase [Mycobacterium paraseoulense]
MNLGQVFDPRQNALNAWRLTLATSVIVGHSFILTGHAWTGAEYIAAGGVDGFFAVSGFLITASWLRHPHLRDYSAARVLRILPGYYVCLVVTAFVIAPIGVAIQGGAALKLLLSTAPVAYVAMNSAVVMLKADVGGTPQGVPYPGSWNSSLWTLVFELGCYAAVAAIGIAGLAHRRWVSPVILAAAVLGEALSPPIALGQPFAGQFAAVVSRFAVMFAAGALLYQWRDKIPARWWLVAASAVTVALGGTLLPHYRLLGGIPLAYAVIASGAMLRNKRLRLRTDLSYGVYIYAFPIQQLLVICWPGRPNAVVHAAVAAMAILPLAALSWFLVEKPAMSLKARLLSKWAAAEAAAAKPDHAADARDLMLEEPTGEVSGPA